MPKSAIATAQLDSYSKNINGIRKQHESISHRTTNPLYVQTRPGKKGMNFDFVDEGYMRQVLNDEFPEWSWEIIQYELVGDDSVAVHGRLLIVDNNISRSFDAVAAHGRSGDLGNDMKSANTEAFKLACNRLCNISDDVYRKSVLSQKQLDDVDSLIPQLKPSMQEKIKEAVATHGINPSNYEISMETLQALITTKEKENG